jgi:hypothetical protein
MELIHVDGELGVPKIMTVALVFVEAIPVNVTLGILPGITWKLVLMNNEKN